MVMTAGGNGFGGGIFGGRNATPEAEKRLAELLRTIQSQKIDIKNNRKHLNNLKGKNSSEWREYATQCMVEIINNKTK